MARHVGDYLVAEVHDQGRRAAILSLIPLLSRRRGALLARFSPDGADGFSEHQLTYQDTTSVPPPHFAWRVLGAERMGPVIEIIRPPAASR